MQKPIRKLQKCFANCELQTANLNHENNFNIYNVALKKKKERKTPVYIERYRDIYPGI